MTNESDSSPVSNEARLMDRRAAIKRSAAAVALGATLGIPVRLEAASGDSDGTAGRVFLKIEGVEGESGTQIFEMQTEISERELGILRKSPSRVYLKWYDMSDGRRWELRDQSPLSERVTRSLKESSGEKD